MEKFRRIGQILENEIAFLTTKKAIFPPNTQSYQQFISRIAEMIEGLDFIRILLDRLEPEKSKKLSQEEIDQLLEVDWVSRQVWLNGQSRGWQDWSEHEEKATIKRNAEFSETVALIQSQTVLVVTLTDLERAARTDAGVWQQHCRTVTAVNRTLLKHIQKLHDIRHNSEQESGYDLMPEWSECPEWCMWWTVDADGEVSYWSKEPLIDGNMWYHKDVGANKENIVWMPNGERRYIKLPIGLDWRCMIAHRSVK